MGARLNRKMQSFWHESLRPLHVNRARSSNSMLELILILDLIRSGTMDLGRFAGQLPHVCWARRFGKKKSSFVGYVFNMKKEWHTCQRDRWSIIQFKCALNCLAAGKGISLGTPTLSLKYARLPGTPEAAIMPS